VAEPTAPPPPNPIRYDAELDLALERLGEIQRSQDLIRSNAAGRIAPLNAVLATLNDEVRKIEAERDKELDELQAAERKLFLVIIAYAMTHWTRLLDGKRKIIRRSGEIWKRRSGAAFVIDDEAAFVERAKRLGQTRFVRTIEEPNRKAMGDDPAAALAIEGVSQAQDVKYSVQPTGEDVIADFLSRIETEMAQPPS
jgi:phage host-nuclease inhibitor protein Gam